VSGEEYAEFLRTGKLDDRHLRAIMEHCEGIANLAAEIEILPTSRSNSRKSGIDEILQLCREAGPKTIPMHELATAAAAGKSTSAIDPLTESREYMQNLNDDWLLGLSEKELRQWALIHAKFRSHPLRLVQRFWRHKVGLENVFSPLSTDPVESEVVVDISAATDTGDSNHVFGPMTFIPLHFDEPKRLTSIYPKVVKRLREEIAKGTDGRLVSDSTLSATKQQIAQLQASHLRSIPISFATTAAGEQPCNQKISLRGMSTSTLDADAYALADECLDGLETALMKRQFWEARARQIHDAFARNPESYSAVHCNKASITDRVAEIDADIEKCKTGVMPLLQTIAVQNPGKYNQSRLRSIDDPSAYRNRIGAFADHTEWTQVESEACELWELVCAQVNNEALRKNTRAKEQYAPSSTLSA